MCFLCLWNNRDDINRFRKKKLGNHVKIRQLKGLTLNTPLVILENVLLPPPHIKLGLVKTIVEEAINHDSAAFMYLKEKFGHFKNEGKLQAGVFIGPGIRKLLLDDQFTEKLNSTTLDA